MRRVRWLQAATAVAVVAVAALAVDARLDETRSPVIPAEDPFTHMALVRAHLADGDLGPLHDGGDLYPPGFHSLAAAYHVYTGLALHDLFRYGGLVLGLVGVAGAAYLARPLGRPAALLAGVAYAVVPELVFRTTMMAPTAVDVAILPWVMASFLHVARGQLAWTGAVAVMTGFLVLSHPWVLALLAPAGLLWALMTWLVPWRSGPAHARGHTGSRRGSPDATATARSGAPSLAGVLILAALLGAATGLAVTGCAGQCGPGILRLAPENTFGEGTGHDDALGAFLVALAIPLPFLVRWQRLRRWWMRRVQAPSFRLEDGVGGRPSARGAPWRAAAMSATLALGALAVTWYAYAVGLPPLVDPPGMFGRPLLLLGAAGLALAPFWRHPVGHLAAAWSAATFPFVMIDLFDSPYWSHRTGVYLAIGLVLLATLAAQAIVTALAALARAVVKRASRSQAPRRFAAGAAALLATVGLAAGVAAATPEPPDWYRLYDDCQSDALRDLAQEASDDALLVTGAWQSKLIVAAYAPDPLAVWYVESLFAPQFLEDVSWMARDRPVLVVADPRAEAPPDDLALPLVAGACDKTILVYRVPPHV